MSFYRCTSDFQVRIGESFMDYRFGDLVPADDPIAATHAQYFAPYNGFVTDDVAAKVDAVADSRRQVQNLAGRSEITAGQLQRVASLTTHIERTSDDVRESLAARDDKIEALRNKAIEQPGALISGDGARGVQRPATREAQQDGEIRRNLDHWVKRDHMTGEQAERVDTLLRSGSEESQSLARRWASVATDENYVRSFGKLAKDPLRGHLLWTPEEADSYRKAEGVMRALAIGTNGGGSMVPAMLDPAIMLRNNGSIDPMREVARVVQTVTSSWTGVSSTGATASWKAELDEAPDGSPSLDPEDIPVHMGVCDVNYSFELEMDAVNLVSELRRIAVDAAENLNATAYVVGTGTGQPKGFVTGLAGTSSEVTSITPEVLAVADVYALQSALGARFNPSASWLSNLAVINILSQFETSSGSKQFDQIENNRLLRRALYEVSNMDGSINPAASEINRIMAYGDWKKAFVIVDRIGSMMEIVPGYGANRRPNASRHALLYWRTGSDVVVPEAARLLRVNTSA